MCLAAVSMILELMIVSVVSRASLMARSSSGSCCSCSVEFSLLEIVVSNLISVFKSIIVSFSFLYFTKGRDFS